MARNNNSSAATEKAAEEIPLPKGLRNISADIDAWYKPEVSGTLHGKLISMEERQDRPGTFFFAVQLLAPCKAVLKAGEEKMLEAGQIIGLGERKALEKLRRYVLGQSEIFIRPTEKVPTRSGNSFWKFQLAVSGKEGPLPGVLMPQHPAPGDDDNIDDLPFR